ncbi:MAG: porin family protein [Henriciella sp.]|nr:porin family protein [Henriciella sp.]
MQIRIISIAISTFVTVAAPVAGAESFYVEGNYNRVQTDSEPLSEFQGDDTEFDAIGFRAGYNFATNLAIEGEFLAGLSDDIYAQLTEDGSPVAARASLETNAGVFVRAGVPVTEKVQAFARVGYATTQFAHTYYADDPDLSTTVTRTNDGPAYGVGATIDISENIYLRTDYTLHDTDEVDTGTLSIGAGLRF